MLRSFRLRRARMALRALLPALPLFLAASCSSADHPSRLAAPAATSVREGDDTFGVGEGRSGPLTVSAAGTVINTYAPIVSVDSTGTRVGIGPAEGATAPFAPGDLLMFWVTTGITTAEPGDQGPFDLGTDVGRYEFGRIKSVSGAVVTLTNPLSSTGTSSIYATGSQVIRVPEYTSVTITGGAGIVPYRWDGSSGGVIVFFATGAVDNEGSISADFSGFRGGQVENAASIVASPGCSALTGSDESTPSCGGAHKGEGLDPAAYATAAATPGGDPAITYGEGNYTIGGGGGDARNAGGGGGGGFGQGGSGGDSADGMRLVGGFGGGVVSYDPTTAFVTFGGGGGAGDEDHMTGSDGAAGGGVVLVRATSFAGDGTYSADGGSVTGIAGTDGSGGGGAGGAVLLFSINGITCGSATAAGGSGGSGGSEPDGPGGGGGGGLVYLEASSATCPGSVVGGAAGTTTASGMSGSTYGASGGAGGQSSVGTGAAFGGGACTPALVGMNMCGGCVTDSDCPSMEVCDATTNTCGVCSLTNAGQCTGTTSACAIDDGVPVCVPCTGDFGAMVAAPCPTAALPSCVTSGPALGTCGVCATGADCPKPTEPACSSATLTCTACDGDLGSSAVAPCSVSSAPYCTAAGTCGKCTSDTDCTGNHAGPRCDTAKGACGYTCTTDTDCATPHDGGPLTEAGTPAPEWCDMLGDAGTNGICQPKVANGQPVPGGTCTTTIGARACLAGACDTTDNECGIGSGGMCTSPMQCRSGACPSQGPNSGTCEPCSTDTDCTSPALPACSPTTNECVACTSSNTSTCTGQMPACNPSTNTCGPCAGDFGSSSALSCSKAAPTCTSTGACTVCQTSVDCEGSLHSGDVCDRATGACVSVCSFNSQCPPGEWCTAGNVDGGMGTCKAELADGTPLPTTPADFSTCTTAVGMALCKSGVCNPKNNTCGSGADGGMVSPDGSVVSADGGRVVSNVPVGTSLQGGACAMGRGPGDGGRSGALFGLGVALLSLVARRRRS